ncbi:MAG: Stk1 family PASTA domain-containing Ser/Thr kinase, partial [Clostridia bacterium]
MNIIGKTIANRYEIISKTGVGGMATVYKAKDIVLNRNVAVKVLKDEFITDEEFVKRFNSEAQAAASLTHPNIVSIYDVGNEGDIYYIVMELVRGKTLKQIITEEGALPWKWSVNIAMQIASALETAHKNNIVHRDIKPHNIIITEDGVAKVTDFGIAKAVSNSTITAFGTTIGSVHYFSPEQAKGGYTDAKSDIYSLGVVMYEMLTGKVPFDSDTSVSVALKHMQEDPIEPIKIKPELPQSVNDIIMKAMRKDANERYQSATEMIKDLELALKHPEEQIVSTPTLGDSPTQKISLDYAEELQKQEKRKKPGKMDKIKKY